jgi:predicted transposase YbfD/YdcC
MAGCDIIFCGEGIMAKKSAKIAEIKGMLSGIEIASIEAFDVQALIDLRVQFNEIEDKRFQPYVEHFLSDIVMIVLLAVMANSDEWTQIIQFAVSKEQWLRKFLVLPNGIPSHDTIRRVMATINGNILYSLSITFLITRLDKLSDISWAVRAERERLIGSEIEAERPIIALDGKATKGSKRKKTDIDAVKAMHTVSAWSTDYGLCLAEKVVEDKSNEIPAVREVIAMLNISGSVLTWDALNTQKDTVALVVSKKGDYVGALKENQQTLYEDVSMYFDGETFQELEKSEKTYMKTVNKEQSAVAIREYYLTTDIKWMSQRKEWEGFTAIGCARRTLNKMSGEKTEETRYFISSISDVKLFGRAVRTHWQVENKLHWQLDYTFKDDQNTTLQKNGARNLQTMKRVALAILTLCRPLFPKLSVKRMRYGLSLDFERDIERMFKVLNTNALRSLLLPKPG